MKIEIKAPSPGESITEVTLSSWIKKSGDFVEKSEEIAEVESEKATLPIYADISGILETIVEEGKEIVVGEIIATIDGKETITATDNEKKTTTTTATAENIVTIPKTEEKQNVMTEINANTPTGKIFDVVIPSPGESITEVVLGEWMKQDGDFIAKEEFILEVESEKATLPIHAELGGILRIKIQTGKTAKVGDVIATIEESNLQPTKTPKTVTVVEEPKSDLKTTKIASPSAAKMMKEEKIHLSKGSGRGGRITKEDVILYKNNLQKTQVKIQPAVPVVETIIPAKLQTPLEENMVQRKVTATFSDLNRQTREITTKKLSFIRKKIAERLTSVSQNTAMLTTFNEVNMGEIMKVRSQYKDNFQKSFEIKLGFLSFFAKASCLALKEFPEVNSQINMEKNEQQLHNYVDLGIAVSAPKGLMVPVIQDADKMSFASLEKKIVELAQKARSNQIQVKEMSGGTFTITNGGIFGSMLSTPILNPPQSAILGMHNITKRAVVINDKVEIADMMYLALSYDHRIIDGKEAVGFLIKIKEYLEDPVRMLIEI